MKQHNQKKSIAWFKLAEYISRGEKERALGLYRLLSHTIENSPFEYQLAGDILLACNDTERAVEKYVHAADVYEKEKKYVHASGVYEHIMLLCPQKKEYKIKRAVLAAYMQDEENLGRLIGVLCTDQLLCEAMHTIIELLCASTQKNIRLFCWQASAIYALKYCTLAPQDMQAVCKKTAALLSTQDNTLALEKFLARVNGIDAKLAESLRENMVKDAGTNID